MVPFRSETGVHNTVSSYRQGEEESQKSMQGDKKPCNQYEIFTGYCNILKTAIVSMRTVKYNWRRLMYNYLPANSVPYFHFY